MDGANSHGYLFMTAGMTESYGVGMGPLPLYWGVGEGTKLRLLRWLDVRGWALLGASALGVVLPGLMMSLAGSARAEPALEERKLPMKFSWVVCEPNCRGWVSAVGVVTADSPGEFDQFARGRNLGGATVVLDSSGGSVNDAITLGRRWRSLGLLTTVGTSIETHTARGVQTSIMPDAYCESMCVFLLLSGKTRYVPDGAHIRVHQIWMGDRADDAKAANYTAQDLMIVERDVGRLAKYTFDMGGAGDLLSLSLSVPPWENLHELSRDELRLTNLVTTDAVAEVLPDMMPKNGKAAIPVAELATSKPVQDRFVGNAMQAEAQTHQIALPEKSTRTAEAVPPTGATGATPTK
jgi:hypothetical protein